MNTYASLLLLGLVAAASCAKEPDTPHIPTTKPKAESHAPHKSLQQLRWEEDLLRGEGLIHAQPWHPTLPANKTGSSHKPEGKALLKKNTVIKKASSSLLKEKKSHNKKDSFSLTTKDRKKNLKKLGAALVSKDHRKGLKKLVTTTTTKDRSIKDRKKGIRKLGAALASKERKFKKDSAASLMRDHKKIIKAGLNGKDHKKNYHKVSRVNKKFLGKKHGWKKPSRKALFRSKGIGHAVDQKAHFHREKRGHLNLRAQA